MIDLGVRERIASITLNRPEVLNSLDRASLLRLGDVLEELDARQDVRVIILTGAGGNFCAGDDLREAVQLTSEGFHQMIYAFQRITRIMRKMNTALIAAVDGYAVGGGFEIAMSCDLRVCSDRAKFATPEVGVGMIVTNGTSTLLTRLIGDGRAREMILTGEAIDAARAYEIGLVSRVVPPEELQAAARELAERIASRSAAAVSASKRLLDEMQNPDLERAIFLESDSIVKLFNHPDHKEGIRAFVEKREPKFED